MTDADQRPTPNVGDDPVEENPYAAPKDDVPAPPTPWGAPPEQPYGQVKPGPVQPWGTQRPREPEKSTEPAPWGDPNRYGGVRPREDQRPDPDRRYKDQRETGTQDRPARPQRDLPTRWALGLSLGATACTMLGLYQGLATFPSWMIGSGAGFVLALAAFVMAIRAQRLAATTGKRAPEATASLVSACVSGTLAMLVLVTSVVWFGPLKDYAKCIEGANTQAAQTVCTTMLKGATGMR